MRAYEIAGILERKAISRVPVVADGRIVGIVSRANLVQALASMPRKAETAVSDASIRQRAAVASQREALSPHLAVQHHRP